MRLDDGLTLAVDEEGGGRVPGGIVLLCEVVAYLLELLYGFKTCSQKLLSIYHYGHQ